MMLLFFSFLCFSFLCIPWNILANGSTAIPEICHGDLENGTYEEIHNITHGTFRRYNCSVKHFPNIHGRDNYMFKCDSYITGWRSTNTQYIVFLSGVRCSENSTTTPEICLGDLENRTCTEDHDSTHGTVRRYNCSEKHVSSEPGLDNIAFKCDSNSTKWMSINTKKVVFLSDVLCNLPSTTTTTTLTSSVPSTTTTKTTFTSSVPSTTTTKKTLTSSVPPTTSTKTTLTSSVPSTTMTKTILTSSVPSTTTTTTTRLTSSVPSTKTTKLTHTSSDPSITTTTTTLTSYVPSLSTSTTLTSSGPSSTTTRTRTTTTTPTTEQHPSTTSRTSSISKQCLADIDYMGNVWNQSDPGIETRTTCPEGFIGQVSRLCDDSGVYQTPLYNCTRTELNNILNQVKQADFNATNVLDDLVEATESHTNTNDTFLLGDLDTVNTIMVKVIDSIGENFTHAMDLVDPFLDVADNMLGENTALSWTIKINKTGEGVNTLLENIDDLIERIVTVTNASNISSTEFQKSNLYLKIGSTASSVYGVSFPDRDKDLMIPEWAENTRDLINVTFNQGENRSYSSVIYKNISNLVPLTTATSTYRNFPVQNGAPVISFTFHPRDDRKLDIPVLIRFQLFENSSIDPVCSFWKKENSSSGGYWSSDGCWLASFEKTEGIVECKCDHLTKYTVLINLAKNLFGKLGIVLSNISIVGCVVSMLELFITIVERIHSWRKKKSKSDNLLKVNLCCTLLVADLLYTIGIDQTDNKEACTAVAVLLHFVYLAAFFTMLAQGLCIAYVVIKQSVESREQIIIPLVIVAYVISGVTVAVSVGAVQLEGYGTSKFCWLSTETGLIWTFIGPVICILFINIVIATAFVCWIRRNVAGLQNSDKENVKADLRNVMVLMPVIGLTWVFGILSIDDDQILFHYLFAIFNIFQGLLIFIFNCCMENKIQKAISSCKSRKRKQCKSSESEEDHSEYADDYLEGPLELSIPPLNKTIRDL